MECISWIPATLQSGLSLSLDKGMELIKSEFWHWSRKINKRRSNKRSMLLCVLVCVHAHRAINAILDSKPAHTQTYQLKICFIYYIYVLYIYICFIYFIYMFYMFPCLPQVQPPVAFLNWEFALVWASSCQHSFDKLKAVMCWKCMKLKDSFLSSLELKYLF